MPVILDRKARSPGRSGSRIQVCSLGQIPPRPVWLSSQTRTPFEIWDPCIPGFRISNFIRVRNDTLAIVCEIPPLRILRFNHNKGQPVRAAR